MKRTREHSIRLIESRTASIEIPKSFIAILKREKGRTGRSIQHQAEELFRIGLTMKKLLPGKLHEEKGHSR